VRARAITARRWCGGHLLGVLQRPTVAGWAGRRQVKRTKPEPRACPLCHAVAGVSHQSLLVHMRTKHAGAPAAL